MKPNIGEKKNIPTGGSRCFKAFFRNLLEVQTALLVLNGEYTIFRHTPEYAISGTPPPSLPVISKEGSDVFSNF